MKTPLQRARERRGLRQFEVAAEVGVDKSHYYRVEAGEARASADFAKRLARFFGPPLTRDEILFPEEYVRGLKAPRPRPASL